MKGNCLIGYLFIFVLNSCGNKSESTQKDDFSGAKIQFSAKNIFLDNPHCREIEFKRVSNNRVYTELVFMYSDGKKFFPKYKYKNRILYLTFEEKSLFIGVKSEEIVAYEFKCNIQIDEDFDKVFFFYPKDTSCLPSDAIDIEYSSIYKYFFWQ